MTTKLFFKTVDGKYLSLEKAVKPEDKVHKVMGEFKRGTLKSSSGQKVTSRDQAIAIAMSESGMSKKMVHDMLIDYDTMEKARPTKYIKRVPKPSGKGYYYFYTREQVKEFQEKGIVPKEEKERKGILGAWSALADYFGITGNRNSDETKFREKIQSEYSKHENKLKESGADISTFAQHLNEFLSNKEKWLAKFSGEKKEKGEAKPKSEKPKSEKKEMEGPRSGKKWNMSVMRTIAGIYGGGEKEKSGSEKFKEAAKESVDNMKNAKSQKIVNFKGDDTDYHVVDSWKENGKEYYRVVMDDSIDAFHNQKDVYRREAMSEVVPASEFEDKKSPDNFDTMPEEKGTKKEEVKNPPDGMLRPRITYKYSNQKNILPAKVGIKFNIDEEKFLLSLPNVEKNWKGQFVINIKDEKDLDIFDEIKWSKTKSEIKSEQKKTERKEKEKERIENEQKLFNENKILSNNIDEVFGIEENIINSANKAELIKFLNGTNKNFNGIINRNWEEPLEKMGALSEEDENGKRKIDWNKIKQFLNKNSQEDNFDTMPEGEDKYKKIASHKDWVSGATITESRKENRDTIFVATIDGWRNFPIYEGKPGDEISKKVQEKVREIRDKLKSGDESILNENTSINQKPSATEAKEIERTERFPDVPTYAEVPEGFKKVEGTNAPKGYEFYRNGSPLSKDYKQVLVKDKSKVEALKEELGKKKNKSESKEREITVFGKQQKVKTKPIELNLGYEHPFEIAKRDFGNGRSDWVILESSTGLKVGDGKTQKDAIENAETMIKKYTKSESEFKQLVEKNNPENIKKKDDKPEQEARKQVEKDFEDKSSKGQDSIKKMEEEDKKIKKQKENLQSKDPQKRYDALKQTIEKDKEDLKDTLNFNYMTDEGEFYDKEGGDKLTLQEAIEENFGSAYPKRNKTSGGYVSYEDVDFLKDDWTDSIVEGSYDEDKIKYIKEVVNKYKQFIKNKKELADTKEELLGPKMFKALFNLREELMIKAATTKYIKRIPNPKGQGYIYFYTPEQVKAYQKDGTLPDQKKEGEAKKEGKGNIEILKESVKKVASIFADALSARDTVQPTGQVVEQTGENIKDKAKEKKRLEEKKASDKNKSDKKSEVKPNK
jgi:hypothetical protein